MMKLVDMKMSPADMKADAVPMASGERDPYPYGLVLQLDTDEIDKLGIADLPEIGQEYHIMAVGKVTRVSSSASEGQDEESRGISVQITMMCVDTEPMMGEEKSTPKAEKREMGAKSVMSNAYGG